MAHRASLGILQANLNHCRRAQDLMVYCLAEWPVGLAVASEPYRVPDHPHWIGDEEGLEAVWYHRHSATVPPCTVVERGRGMVLVKWGRFLLPGCYNSPNCSAAELERFLDRLGAMLVPYMAGPVLVLGDLNARSTAWGNPGTSSRGGALQDWAEGMELRLLNRGSVPTCVRRNGWSIVNVSFASAAASCCVSNWRVWDGETLSDHCYVLMDVAVVSDPPADTPLRRGIPSASRCTLKRLGEDLLRAVIIGSAWPLARERGAEEGVVWIQDTLQMRVGTRPESDHSVVGRIPDHGGGVVQGHTGTPG
ncbi:uncharacterized protein LOC128884966 [Hylaeus volcanicus]|uniref:uncharacterized protein LOC128884966 n=1 Tax=Hylaeus volcanicus TaxID=313075 RepID=UPI0023B87A1E|nr:uncharacterized protein LOC128884966 [Hylaeus volcanicus]